ncbi:ArnT family glycosyltransferase [Aromatoleum aromaticum]|uniref:ArnT family glycosyltransferase n=1 Tax=Aromatoleum aromaticum TaxID=551760 RepID=UPI001B7D0DF0|nr:glycosyltransferase family 39 protein [Aromatoleum aromaticum]
MLLLFFWGIGDIPFLSVNEARRAVTVREMYAGGQWLLPVMNGSLYLAKPPLFYWMALVPVHMLGAVSEWVMRLPSALFALTCCGAVYALGARLAGREVGLYAVIFLAANSDFSAFARRAEIEMSLTGLCLLSLLAAWPYLFGHGGRRWVLLSYALLGACLLTKGPVSLLFVTAPLLVFALLLRHARAKALLCDVGGWTVALAIGVSWYLAVSWQEGWGVWSPIFEQDVVAKVSGAAGEPWYSYLLYLMGAFSPFCLVLLVRPRLLWQEIRAHPELALLACSVLVPLLAFSLFSDKHAKYLLPAYPALALLLAYRWVHLLGSVPGGWRRLMTRLPLLLLLAFVAFYAFFESRAFAHRVQVLPQIAAASADHPSLPIYSVGAPDMRLVYYAGRPVLPLTAAGVGDHSSVEALLFVKEPMPGALAWMSNCALAQFEPYLAKRKSVLLIRLGPSCARRPT